MKILKKNEPPNSATDQEVSDHLYTILDAPNCKSFIIVKGSIFYCGVPKVFRKSGIALSTCAHTQTHTHTRTFVRGGGGDGVVWNVDTYGATYSQRKNDTITQTLSSSSSSLSTSCVYCANSLQNNSRAPQNRTPNQTEPNQNRCACVCDLMRAVGGGALAQVQRDDLSQTHTGFDELRAQ